MSEVQLGYVESWKAAQRLQGSAFDSYVGGVGSPFSGSLPRELKCKHCGQALVLVIQVFAPADTDRNIVVYACNSSSCYAPGRVSGTWRAFRAQVDSSGPSTTVAPGATNTAAAKVANITEASNSLGGDDWGAGGAWGSDDAVDAAAAQLERVRLEAAEAQSQAAAAAQQSKAAAAEAATADSSEVLNTPHFPRFVVQTCAEPEDEDEDDEDDREDYGDGEDDGTAGGAGGSSRSAAAEDAALAHAKRLYEEYQRREGLEASGAAAGGAGAASGAGCGDGHGDTGADGFDVDEEDEDEDDEDAGHGAAGGAGRGLDDDDPDWREPHAKDWKRASKLSSKSKGGDTRAGADRRRLGGSGAGRAGDAAGGRSSGGGGGDSGDTYEAVPAKYRYALAFQKRVSIMPEQVVRYEWAGKPLWPCPPPLKPSGGGRAGRGGRGGGDRGLVVPPCPHCGGPRNFEMQLMPGLLFGLKPEDYDEHGKPITRTGQAAAGGRAAPVVAAAACAVDPSSGEAAAGPGSALAPLPGGMDWQSVFIYSCETSCGGAGLAEEWVYVVPPDVE